MRIDPTSRARPEAIKPADEAKLEKACADFEGVLLRQLLTVAKVGEQAGKSGYGSMVIDALAGAISDGGGLGLTTQIKDALSKKHLEHAIANSVTQNSAAASSPAVLAPNTKVETTPRAPVAEPAGRPLTTSQTENSAASRSENAATTGRLGMEQASVST